MSNCKHTQVYICILIACAHDTRACAVGSSLPRTPPTRSSHSWRRALPAACTAPAAACVLLFYSLYTALLYCSELWYVTALGSNYHNYTCFLNILSAPAGAHGRAWTAHGQHKQSDGIWNAQKPLYFLVLLQASFCIANELIMC